MCSNVSVITDIHTNGVSVFPTMDTNHWHTSDLDWQFESVDDDEHEPQIIGDFSLERNTLLQRHQTLTKEFTDVLNLQQEKFQAAEEDQRQEFDILCEEIKNKNMEDLNVLDHSHFSGRLLNHIRCQAETTICVGHL